MKTKYMIEGACCEGARIVAVREDESANGLSTLPRLGDVVRFDGIPSHSPAAKPFVVMRVERLLAGHAGASRLTERATVTLRPEHDVESDDVAREMAEGLKALGFTFAER